MKMTPLQRRAERKSRNSSSLDMNLVALIDIFTILIFFLLSSASGIELLTAPNAAKLPEAKVDIAPKETVVVVVSGDDIVVDGRKVASVAAVIDSPDDVIAGLKAELDVLAARPSLKPVVAGEAAPAKLVTIMGDKNIPYRLLRKVMVTSARANYSDVSFAVRRKDV